MAGSVGIAENQTGIYPNVSPGGWNVIGNSPIQFFNPLNTPPCFANSGDIIEFYPISKEEHENIKIESKSNLNYMRILND